MKRSDWTRLNLPDDFRALLAAAPEVAWPGSTADLLDRACGWAANNYFEVRYEIPGKPGTVLEATVARARNGIVVNYPEPYMRRREPDCMFIADDLPSDKPRFKDRFGYAFDGLRKETLDWLATQRLAAFAFTAGPNGIGVDAVAVVPMNAAFFALGLAMLQGMRPLESLGDDFNPRAVLYVAPPFRHTHFEGRQVVVHARGENLHEMFAYNLYPGPSAKKGIYGVLLQMGERDGWVVPHCSTVQVVTPYDNVVTIMHEGASGGGKSEMLEQIHREPDGRLLMGRNLVNGDQRHLEIPRACKLHPVTDDIAIAHPSLAGAGERTLRLMDAEDAWFVRVNHIDDYGTDPFLEKLTAQPPEPLVFLNIDAVPGSRALIWEHIEDAPGKPCPNARVIMPRRIVPNVVEGAVTVDIRSFGVRTPPCTKDRPTYGIIGIFHLLPPALAWLWRLVSPRGHANPSIVGTEGMSSEGVGSYWPFATGRRVAQANLLLRQFEKHRSVRYILCPNQHIGAWATGFMPQWIAREYLARRGHAQYRPDQFEAARCPLLGWTVRQLQVEGRVLPQDFLQVNTQPEVGDAAYDAGAEILHGFFKSELKGFLEPELSATGRKIIDCCLSGGTVDDYATVLKVE